MIFLLDQVNAVFELKSSNNDFALYVYNYIIIIGSEFGCKRKNVEKFLSERSDPEAVARSNNMGV